MTNQEGMARAIKLIEKRRETYIRENCKSIGNGGDWEGTVAQEEYVSELDDIIELFRKEQEGAEDAEEQGVESRRRTSEHLPATGGRTERLAEIMWNAREELMKFPVPWHRALNEEDKSAVRVMARAAVLSSDTGGREEPMPEWAKARLRQNDAGERESIATAVEGYTDILSPETARKVARRIRSLGEKE